MDICGENMIRTITIVSAFLLAISSTVYAEDRESYLLNLGFKHQQLRSVDTNVSTQEYQKLYTRNQRFVLKTLGSHSKGALKFIGIPERGINYMGAAVGVIMNGSRLNLNKSKTLALEVKNVGDSEPTWYFGFSLDW